MNAERTDNSGSNGMNKSGDRIDAAPLLVVEHLNAGYGKLTILHDVSVSVPAGGFTAILGPNGSGKSTLLKAVFGLADVMGGTIALDGARLDGLPTEAVSYRGIAYVPQRGNVFAGMTVAENLHLATRTLPRHAAHERYEQIYTLFPVLQERKRQRAGKLSGGERQMLAIAIAALVRPRLILLDEPSAGLSPLFVTEVFRTLRRLCDEGITLAVVEQNARSILRWCDSAYVLREGRVVYAGTAQELADDEELAKSYLGVARRV
jgi:ABC-type branched-subunit amino acid transport system ATPase component